MRVNTTMNNSYPVTEALPIHAPDQKIKRWIALTVLMLPVLLVSVDNTVLAFAVPSIAQALEPSSSEQLWIVDAYSLVLAGLLVPMGSLGDRIGRRKILLIGSIGFAVISALAAFAPTALLLVIARAVLGFFGAMLMPATLSLIRNIFRDPKERRTAIAVWAAEPFLVGVGVPHGGTRTRTVPCPRTYDRARIERPKPRPARYGEHPADYDRHDRHNLRTHPHF